MATLNSRLAFLLSLVVLVCPSFSHAYVISQQLISTHRDFTGAISTQLNENVGAKEYLFLGTGLAGTPVSLTMSLDEALFVTDGCFFKAHIFEMTTAATSSYTGNQIIFTFCLNQVTQKSYSSATTSYVGAFNASTAFDPTKFYYMEFEQGTSQAVYVWGANNTDVASGFQCFPSASFTCGGLTGAPYYILSDDAAFSNDGSLVTYVTPASHEASTTVVTIGGGWHVGAKDLAQGQVSVLITLQDLNQFQLTALDGITTLYSATQANSGNFATSSVYSLSSGNYAAKVRINYPSGARYITNSFIAGTSTVIGLARSKSLDDFNQFVTTISSTSSISTSGQCPLWNLSNSAFAQCLAFLFIPDTETVLSNLTTVLNVVKYIPPWGYVVLANDAINTASTVSSSSSLPYLINTTLPTGFPGAGTAIRVDVFGNLLGAGTLLSNAREPNSGLSLKEIVQPGWNNLIYFLFILALLREFAGIGTGSLDTESRAYRNEGIRQSRL